MTFDTQCVLFLFIAITASSRDLDKNISTHYQEDILDAIRRFIPTIDTTATQGKNAILDTILQYLEPKVTASQKLIPEGAVRLISFIIHCLEHFQSKSVILMSGNSMTESLNHYLTKETSKLGLTIQILDESKMNRFSKSSKNIQNIAFVLVSDLDALSADTVAWVRNNVNIGHWLIRHESLSLESFRKHDILPAINSYVWLFREVANVSFLLDDVYSIHNNKVTLTRNPIGKWSPTSGLDIDDTNPIQERRRDLMGISFKATDPPWVSAELDSNGIVEVSGKPLEILKALSSRMNFSLTFSLVKDGQYGVVDKDGNFNGIIGELQRGETDGSFVFLTLLESRTMVADPTIPLGYYTNSLYYKKAAQGSAGMDWTLLYLMPLNLGVWLSMSMAFLLCGVLLYLDREPYVYPPFLIVLNGMFCQGVPNMPDKAASRIVCLVIFTLAMLMHQAYSATLTSFLAAVKDIPPFTNLKTMMDLTDYRVATVKGCSFENFFKNGGPLERKIFDSRLDTFENLDEALHAMEVNSDNLVVYDSTSALEEKTRGSCKLTSVPTWRQTYLYSFYTRKHFPYLGIINFNLAKMAENGVLDLWKMEGGKNQLQQSHQCLNPEIKSPTIEKVSSLLIFLLVFLILSTLILLCEQVWEQINRN